MSDKKDFEEAGDKNRKMKMEAAKCISGK